MRCTIAMLAIGSILSAATAHASLVKNISTGIDNASGLQLADGATDTDFVVAAGSAGFVGTTATVRSLNLPSTYVTDNASTASRWIGINSGSGIQSMTVAGGDYIFSTSVDLTGFLANTAIISNSRFSADDVLISLRINGTEVFSQAPRDINGDLTAFHSLDANLGAGLFQNGLNTISFEMYNLNGPMMLRFEGALTASSVAVPEPASLTLLAAGAGLLAARKKRRA